MTDWIDTLRDKCKAKSQRRVAERLGISTAAISQALSGKYPSPTDRIQALVEGAYMNRVVHCSVCGPIGTDLCEQYQERPYLGSNSRRVRIYRACHHTCPHSRVREDV